jgi:hypothetical protein
MVFPSDPKEPPSVLVGPSNWLVVRVKGMSCRFWLCIDAKYAPKVAEDPRS